VWDAAIASLNAVCAGDDGAAQRVCELADLVAELAGPLVELAGQVRDGGALTITRGIRLASQVLRLAATEVEEGSARSSGGAS
jgi:hypothetical protein